MTQPANTTAAIDVSASQPLIDWAQVSAAGITDAFVEAFLGNDGPAPDGVAQVAGARAVSVRARGYLFAYALPSDGVHAGRDPLDQVAMWFEQLARMDLDPSLPLVVDAEFPKALDFAKWGESAPQVRAWLLAALAEVERRTGVTPWLYLSPAYAAAIGTAEEPAFARYPLWLAQWDVQRPSVPAPWDSLAAWQHSATGSVQGVEGPVDLSWIYAAV